jgi:putative Mg2+ transporter-C (MgtC) family protein
MNFIYEQAELFIRLILAALCGFAIGFERKRRAKEAGIRTHTIVAIGAALIMIISKYAFWEGESGDSGRLAAQVVSGIGFLGAGMIVYSKGALHGLTTAAGIWATAGVGMAIGAGGNIMLIVGVATTLLIIGVHLFFHLPLKMFKTQGFHQIQVQFVVIDDAVDKIKEIFASDRIYRLRFQNLDEKRVGTLLMKTAKLPSDDEWQRILDENPFITSMEYFEEEWV